MAENTAESEASKSRLNPLFLIVPALTILAQWQESMSVLQFLADICEEWLSFWKEAWRRLFLWLEPYVLRTYPPESYDMLTLIATLASTVGLGGLILSSANGRLAVTTLDEVERYVKAPSILTIGLTAVIITSALAVIVVPFFPAMDLAVTRDAEAVDSKFSFDYGLHSSPAIFRWFTYATMIAGPVFITVARRRSANFIPFSFLGALLALVPVLYLWVPGFGLELWTNPNSALVCGLFATFIFIATRSALPITHLAMLVVSVMLLDKILGVGTDIWGTVQA